MVEARQGYPPALLLRRLHGLSRIRQSDRPAGGEGQSPSRHRYPMEQGDAGSDDARQGRADRKGFRDGAEVRRGLLEARQSQIDGTPAAARQPGGLSSTSPTQVRRQPGPPLSASPSSSSSRR